MLPVDAILGELHELLARHQSVILQAQPGAGKSTAVPLSLLNGPWLNDKKIVMLEPRRVAAKSIAHYLANQLGEAVGQQVGYQIRNERKVSAHTKLEIVTEGILTRRLQQDPELTDVGLLIFDEFHERSVHADIALMLAKEVQEAYRPDLKIMLMSATIDTQSLAEYMGDSAIIDCPGRTFPVDIVYQAKTSAYLDQEIIAAIRSVLQHQDQGDVLVFLPGQGEIKRCLNSAKAKFSAEFECLPLFGSLSLHEQEKALSSEKTTKRRMIFSTNIAETSLTIPGVTAVIDSGLEKVASFDVKSGLTRLVSQAISKASATQRAGRAGRVQPGICIRLWSQAKQQDLAEYANEEIVNTDLSAVLLDLSAWGITRYQDTHWLTAPPLYHYEVASTLNQNLGLLDNENRITDLGKKALNFGVEPRLATMLVRAESQQQQQLAALLAALLSHRDIFSQPSSADLTARLHVLLDAVIGRIGQDSLNFIHHSTLQHAKQLANQFCRLLGIGQWTISQNTPLDKLGSLLLYAYPDRLAKQRSLNGNAYLLANGRGVVLKDSDPMCNEAWLVVCDCDGQNKDGLIYSCVPISLEQIQTQLASSISKVQYFALDSKKEKVVGRLQHHYQNLMLFETPLSDIPPQAFEQCVLDILHTEGLTFLNWSVRCASWLARVRWLGSKVEQFPIINEASLLATVDQWLLPYLAGIDSIKALKRFDIYDLLTANLSWDEAQQLASEAPEYYVTPSDKSVSIRYDESQGPTVSVVLQEMFGQLESPTLAQGKVALRFELLSPARRPVQTTSDLAHFWRNSYFEVAKEMRGRYPKHRWPDHPLLEKPGRSIKRHG